MQLPGVPRPPGFFQRMLGELQETRKLRNRKGQERQRSTGSEIARCEKKDSGQIQIQAPVVLVVLVLLVVLLVLVALVGFSWVEVSQDSQNISTKSVESW